jgi:hypothetical protein
MRKLTDESQHLLMERVAEAAREAALLWFVFSALDALISGRLTAVWAVTNTFGAVGVWLFGIYVEIRTKEHR